MYPVAAPVGGVELPDLIQRADVAFFGHRSVARCSARESTRGLYSQTVVGYG